MRVLHVDTAREWRGGQTQLRLLAGHTGHPVALPADAPLAAALARDGVPVHGIGFGGGWRGARTLGRLVRSGRFDVVAAHTSHAHQVALLAGAAPVIVHRRNDFAPGRLSVPKYRAARGFVAVSDAVRRVLVGAGVASERVIVVHDGVDPRPFEAPVPIAMDAPQGVAVVGAVGALVPHKGHRVLVDAMARLRGRAVAVIAGDGPLRAELTAHIEATGAPVRLLGQVDDVPGLLAGLDVFCHPSLEEGMGQAVVEAMLSGVPVVVTRAGGLPEVVRHGALVPPDDAPALARALADAIAGAQDTEPARRDALARFLPGHMVAGTLEAYDTLLGRATLGRC